MRRSLRQAVLLAALAVQAACSLIPTSPIPQDHYYRLPDAAPVRVYARPPLGGIVGVRALRGVGLYQEQAMDFVQAGRPLELHQYNYRLWVEPPTHLVQDQLVDYLRAAHAAPKVLRYRPGQGMAAVVSGDIERFERVVGKRRDEVVVALMLEYGPPDQFLPRRLSQRYVAKAAVAGHSIDAVARAFGKALDSISARFLADVAALPAAGRRGAGEG